MASNRPGVSYARRSTVRNRPYTGKNVFESMSDVRLPSIPSTRPSTTRASVASSERSRFVSQPPTHRRPSGLQMGRTRAASAPRSRRAAAADPIASPSPRSHHLPPMAHKAVPVATVSVPPPTPPLTGVPAWKRLSPAAAFLLSTVAPVAADAYSASVPTQPPSKSVSSVPPHPDDVAGVTNKSVSSVPPHPDDVAGVTNPLDADLAPQLARASSVPSTAPSAVAAAMGAAPAPVWTTQSVQPVQPSQPPSAASTFRARALPSLSAVQPGMSGDFPEPPRSASVAAVASSPPAAVVPTSAAAATTDLRRSRGSPIAGVMPAPSPLAPPPRSTDDALQELYYQRRMSLESLEPPPTVTMQPADEEEIVASPPPRRVSHSAGRPSSSTHRNPRASSFDVETSESFQKDSRRGSVILKALERYATHDSRSKEGERRRSGTRVSDREPIKRASSSSSENSPGLSSLGSSRRKASASAASYATATSTTSVLYQNLQGTARERERRRSISGGRSSRRRSSERRKNSSSRRNRRVSKSIFEEPNSDDDVTTGLRILASMESRAKSSRRLS